MTAQRLEYASANLTRKPWGPIFVKPSRRSLLFILLTLATAAWLTARHQSWTLTAHVQSLGQPNRLTHFEFTPANRLLACRHLTYVWDADTGRVIHEIPKSEDSQTYGPLTFNHATELLFLQRGFFTARALLYDIESGTLLKEIPLVGEGLNSQLIAAAPTGHRLMVRRTTTSPAIATVTLWDLDATASLSRPLEPIGTLPLDGPARFSPDGRRIAILAPPGKRGENMQFGVFDVATLVPLFIDNQPRQTLGAFSSDGSRIALSRNDYVNTLTQSFSATTGEPLQWFTSAGKVIDAQTSPDGERVAMVEVTSAGRLELSILDLKTGPSAVHHLFNFTHDAPLAFFPDGRQLLTSGPEYDCLGIYDTSSLQPRAILRGQNHYFAHLAISPDATHLAAYAGDDTIYFYRKTGPDCPESPWGALAFPHLWLLIALATAAAFSLRRDADRASSDLTLPVARFALALFLITLPRTLHVLVAACIGERFLTPAPLILLASIGLATGSRFWRLLTLTALAAALPIDLYCLYLLKHASLAATIDTRLFDRWYAVPNLAAFITLALFTALIPLGIYALSRRPK
jgi:WD40 repeat protein